MENLIKRQKRVVRLKSRAINIGEYRSSFNPSSLISLRGVGKEYVCIVAKRNHRITEEQLKSIRMDLLTPKGLTSGKLLKIFNISITMMPNKILTNKGILVRMGKGKAKPKTSVLYLTPGKVCIQFNPVSSLPLNLPVISKILNKFILKYSFFSFKFLL